MKKAVSILLCIVILVSSVSCGILSNKLSDTWAFVTNDNSLPYCNIITFYSDGSCSVTYPALGTFESSYIIDNNQIKISHEGDVLIEGKMVKKSDKIIIEGLDETTELYKVSSFDKKPNKTISELDVIDFAKDSILTASSKVTNIVIGEIEHKDNKYYCTVKYQQDGFFGGNKEETFLWIPGLNKWCRQAKTYS